MPRTPSGPKRPHVSVSRPSKSAASVDLEAALGAVPDTVRQAAILAAEGLRKLGIPHALCGGIAVGAHGYPRSTKYVDFLVGDEAFEHHGPFVTLKVPFEVNGIAVDSVSVPKEGPFLKEELKPPPTGSGDIPVVSLGALVFMKLLAGRLRDKTDLVELVKSGIDVDAVRDYLNRHAPDRLAAFDRIVEAAKGEAENE
jgi:hypothetical protein